MVVKFEFYLFLRMFRVKCFFGWFLSFSDMQQKSYGLLSFFCKRSCQNCFVRVLKIFFRKKSNWKNQIFLKIWETDCFSSGSTANYLLQGCQNCTLYVQRNSLRKKIFTGNYKVFIIFRQWAKKFWLSGKLFAVGLSKLHATCPYEKN